MHHLSEGEVQHPLLAFCGMTKAHPWEEVAGGKGTPS